MKSFAMLIVAFVALIGFAPPAHAQVQGGDIQVTVQGHAGPVVGSASDHFISFSAPVGVPGVGLAPGAYVFRFIAPHSVIQVLNENRSIVYTMFLVRPTFRAETVSDYTVTLRRIRSDAPPRIVNMYLPDTQNGFEFVYPEQEVAIAPRATD